MIFYMSKIRQISNETIFKVILDLEYCFIEICFSFRYTLLLERDDKTCKVKFSEIPRVFLFAPKTFYFQ